LVKFIVIPAVNEILRILRKSGAVSDNYKRSVYETGIPCKTGNKEATGIAVSLYFLRYSEILANKNYNVNMRMLKN